jgi:hypothetical protein
MAIKAEVPFICSSVITGRPTKEIGHILYEGWGENNRHKFSISPPGLIELDSKNVTFPDDSETKPLLFSQSEPALIYFRAQYENKVGFSDLSSAPAGPTLRWRDLVLVNPSVYSIRSQSVAERQDPIFVFLGIMTVTEEDP